jgi:hypothetical protein
LELRRYCVRPRPKATGSFFSRDHADELPSAPLRVLLNPELITTLLLLDEPQIRTLIENLNVSKSRMVKAPSNPRVTDYAHKILHAASQFKFTSEPMRPNVQKQVLGS